MLLRHRGQQMPASGVQARLVCSLAAPARDQSTLSAHQWGQEALVARAATAIQQGVLEAAG